jgi:hypothetical protein
MLTLMPLNLVPGEPAGVASADADADADAGASADADAAGDDGDGLACAWQAVSTRIMIAAATKRNRDTA